MKHISIIVTKGAILGNIEGPRQVFTEVNEFLARIGKPPLFKIQLVGLSKESQLNDGLYTISTDQINDIERTNLIIIPAMYGDLRKAVGLDQDFIPG